VCMHRQVEQTGLLVKRQLRGQNFQHPFQLHVDARGGCRYLRIMDFNAALTAWRRNAFVTPTQGDPWATRMSSKSDRTVDLTLKKYLSDSRR